MSSVCTLSVSFDLEIWINVEVARYNSVTAQIWYLCVKDKKQTKETRSRHCGQKSKIEHAEGSYTTFTSKSFITMMI